MSSQIRQLLRQVPFRPFVLNMESGDRVVVEHPENIAFDPVENGSRGTSEFCVITSSVRVFSTFDAVTSVALADGGEHGN